MKELVKKGVRGKYVARYTARTNVVLLGSDLDAMAQPLEWVDRFFTGDARSALAAIMLHRT